MKSYRIIQSLRRLRKSAVWSVLQANMSAEVLGILHTHLNGRERQLPASTFVQKVELDLEELCANGDYFPETAQQYIANWYNAGYLRKDKLPGAVEDTYELTADAVAAIHFVLAIDRPQSSATESRLSIVLSALGKLSEDTDTDKASRLRRLNAEKARIEDEIERVEGGSIRVLPYNVAMERLREIMNLASDLTGDFRRVRDQISRLHQELREHVMSHEGSRGEVLQIVFDGIRRIETSEAGRTFKSFWQLLNDPESSSALDDELEQILQRKFTQGLNPQERSFLRGIKRSLLDQSGAVREEFTHFSKSLERFVRNSDYMEQRRMTAMIRDAQRSAIALQEQAKPYALLDFKVDLPYSKIRSMGIQMYDPELRVTYVPMADAPESTASLGDIASAIKQSDVDVRALRAAIANVLSSRPSATIGEILSVHPASQGLGTIIGLIEIGSKEGIVHDARETVEWTGADHVLRRGDIPHITFIKGHFNE